MSSGLCYNTMVSIHVLTQHVASEDSDSDPEPTRPSHELAPTAIRKIKLIITTEIPRDNYNNNNIVVTEWSTHATPIIVTPCTELAGPRVQLPHDPLGTFSLFFNNSLVGMIVEETNRYAEQCLRQRNHERYLYNFNVYTGATGEREVALGEKVVLTLSESVKGRHHQLYFDNYFTSFSLLEKLLAQGTYGCGTIRTNRKNFPSEMSEQAKKFQRGGSAFRQCGNTVATSWKDNRVVNVASTLSDPTQQTTVQRRQKDGQQITVECPLCIALYNKYMGGVDFNDQLRGSYHIRWKCKKHYKYVFTFLLDVSIINAMILRSYDVCPPMDQKHFWLMLAEQLVGTYVSRKHAGRPRKRPPLPPSSSIPTEHFPTHSIKRRCVYCRDVRSQPRRKESVWMCQGCEGQPTLCMTGKNDENDCFRLWHTAHTLIFILSLYIYLFTCIYPSVKYVPLSLCFFF